MFLASNAGVTFAEQIANIRSGYTFSSTTALTTCVPSELNFSSLGEAVTLRSDFPHLIELQPDLEHDSEDSPNQSRIRRAICRSDTLGYC